LDIVSQRRAAHQTPEAKETVKQVGWQVVYWFLSSKTRIQNNIFTNPAILLPQMTPKIEKKICQTRP
jgi:hypothetical protein